MADSKEIRLLERIEAAQQRQVALAGAQLVTLMGAVAIACIVVARWVGLI